MRKKFRYLIALLVPLIIVASCEKEKSFETGVAAGTAVFSFDGGTAGCAGAVVSGSYVAGMALSASSAVTLSVNVVTAGTYTISSNTLNGITFSGAGSFATTGVQIITLTASGTPTSSGTFNFTPGTNGCTFSVVVTSGTGGSSGTAAFTFGVGTGNCTGAVLGGTYAAGTPLTAANTVKLEVNVDTIGTYTISTALANGVLFTTSGTFTATGSQTITLTGTGTPAAAGNFSYKPGSATCTFPVTFTTPASTEATYSFDAASGKCSGAVVNGTFIAGTATTASNTILLKVNVTVVGTYSVTTGAVNGVTFSAAGSFATTGAHDLILTSSGTPAAAGTFNYKTGTTGCEFSITVIPAVSAAAFTLAGAPGACTAGVLAGTFKTAAPLSSSNTLTIKVNVTIAGTYAITTNTVDGFKFLKSGVFTVTGDQDVVLTGNGTPALAGTFSFTPSSGSSGCTFDVVVEQTPVDAAVYSCKIDGVFTNFSNRGHFENVDGFFNTPYLYLNGYTGDANGADVPQLQIFITKNDNSAVGAGVYNEKNGILPSGYRIEIDYYEVQPNNDVIIWNTSSNLFTTNPPFTINITSVSSTRVKGTFSGKLGDTLHPDNTQQKTVTEGSFDLPFQ